MHPVNEARGPCSARAHQYYCGFPATYIRLEFSPEHAPLAWEGVSVSCLTLLQLRDANLTLTDSCLFFFYNAKQLLIPKTTKVLFFSKGQTTTPSPRATTTTYKACSWQMMSWRIQVHSPPHDAIQVSVRAAVSTACHRDVMQHLVEP